MPPRSFDDALAKLVNNARDVHRLSSIRDSQSLFSSAKLIAIPIYPGAARSFRVCAPDLIANLKVIAGELARQLVVT